MDIIILAAGTGKRMCSTTSKVLHKLGNTPMIEHVLSCTVEAKPHNIVITVDPAMQDFINVLSQKYNITPAIAYQHEKLGTGHATKLALYQLHNSTQDAVLILYGDTPLITNGTINKMADMLSRTGHVIILLAFQSQNDSYGRIITHNGKVLKIEHGLSVSQDLANSGIILARKKMIEDLLARVNYKNGELYLTDIVQEAVAKGLGVGYVLTNESEAMGINTRHDLAKAELYFQERKRAHFLKSGVTLVAPEHVFFSLDTQISQDTIVHPYVTFGPGVHIASNVEIFSHSHLEACRIEEHASIGPFARIRGLSTIGQHCSVGNFVEITRTHLGNMGKVKHLSYLGNCTVGENSNFGACSVTCNYDGTQKYNIQIGKYCFIGAHSALVSPLTIGDYAVTAAGSTITEDLPPRSLGIARKRQIIKDDYIKNIKQEDQ